MIVRVSGSPDKDMFVVFRQPERMSLDSDDVCLLGCPSISYCHHKQSFSWLHSPRQSYLTDSSYDSWVQTIHSVNENPGVRLSQGSPQQKPRRKFINRMITLSLSPIETSSSGLYPIIDTSLWKMSTIPLIQWCGMLLEVKLVCVQICLIKN